MTVSKVHFSSSIHTWSTPQGVFDDLHKEFGFTLDPCADATNHKCPRYFTEVENGLAQVWEGSVFVNPPYGRQIGQWVRKSYESAQAGATVVMLIPSRTDTSYWHDYVMKADEIRFIRGRLYFNDGMGRAPFPSCVVVFRGKV